MFRLLMFAALVITLGCASEAVSASGKTHTTSVDKDLLMKTCTGQNVNRCNWCNGISCSSVQGCKGSKCKVVVTTSVRTTPGTDKPKSGKTPPSDAVTPNSLASQSNSKNTTQDNQHRTGGKRH
jgi:hypothetical protein